MSKANDLTRAVGEDPEAMCSKGSVKPRRVDDWGVLSLREFVESR